MPTRRRSGGSQVRQYLQVWRGWLPLLRRTRDRQTEGPPLSAYGALDAIVVGPDTRRTAAMEGPTAGGFQGHAFDRRDAVIIRNSILPSSAGRRPCNGRHSVGRFDLFVAVAMPQPVISGHS